MKKLYFQPDSDACYTEGGHRIQMTLTGETERLVYRAKVERGTGYFYCRHFGLTGESNGICGRFCGRYSPRNGKSGICKHHGMVYEQTDDRKTIRL